MNRTLLALAAAGGLGLAAFLVWRKMRVPQLAAEDKAAMDILIWGKTPGEKKKRHEYEYVDAPIQSDSEKKSQAVEVAAGLARVTKAASIEEAITTLDNVYRVARPNEKPTNWAPSLRGLGTMAKTIESTAIASGKSAGEARAAALAYIQKTGQSVLTASAKAAAAKGGGIAGVAGLGMMRGQDLSAYLYGTRGYVGGGILGLRN